MKRHILYTASILFFLLTSCEDVVKVDLQTSKERLVIEALINVEKGMGSKNQTIKLSKTTSFYNAKIVPATGAVVSIKNKNSGENFQFTETEKGIYKTTNFKAVANNIYLLKIQYNKELYTATESYKEVPPISKISQAKEEEESLFSKVIVEFNDIKDIDNFYRINMHVFEENTKKHKISSNFLFTDEYKNGKKIEIPFEEENINKGDTFVFKLYGVSKRFANYMSLINIQSESGGGGLFGTPASNVKGNCINTTNNENYPYGYFSLSEYDVKEYVYK